MLNNVRLEVEEVGERSLELLRGGLLGIMDFNILLLLFILSAAAWNYCWSQTFGNTPRPNNNVHRLNNNEDRRDTSGPSLVCKHCGFNGYTMDRCFKLIGYLAKFGIRNNSSSSNLKFNKRFINNNNFVGSSSSSGLSDEQISKLLSLIKDNSPNDKGKGVQANMAGSNQQLTYTNKNLVNVVDISYLRIKVSHPNGTEPRQVSQFNAEGKVSF
uniref:Ribonuclease H-like domain-containing protein n=1 Tax=Tanacetum cinerariifolium TaxID=118510 RepID=A0A699H9J5_TANCI|nr:ribonuclease H-like domain-containing protein [Tanacetum cinerariifolium]